MLSMVSATHFVIGWMAGGVVEWREPGKILDDGPAATPVRSFYLLVGGRGEPPASFGTA